MTEATSLSFLLPGEISNSCFRGTSTFKDQSQLNSATLFTGGVLFMRQGFQKSIKYLFQGCLGPKVKHD